MKARTFVDSVVVYAAAGHGGNGAVSFRREKYVPRGGPDGGDGGAGGCVIFRADHDEDSLLPLYYAPHRRAETGGDGGGARMTGRDGANLVISVPCGTQVHVRDTGALVGDLVEHGQELIVAQGGRGGRGNWHWRSATHQTPMEHTDGTKGVEVALRVDLKIVADIGLVGFPNAGKSSLLSAISAAHPKVAAYPFTTIHPIIGTVQFENFTSLRVADIPGLIPGAHCGVGLGHDFLRHVERSAALVFIIDMAGVDGRLPHQDYADLRNELGLCNPALLERPMICVANKMDLPEAAKHLAVFRRKTKLKPIEISATEGKGMRRLLTAMRKLCPPKVL